MNFKKILGLALIALIILIALGNLNNVLLSFYGAFVFSLPLGLVIGISAIIGILIPLFLSTKTQVSRKAPASPQTKGSYNGMKLYVGNLPYDTTEEDLINAFRNYGSVRSARIITDKVTGEPRGFGFVEMEHRDDAHLAINELNGSDMHGQQIKVNKAHTRQSGRRNRR